MGSGVTRGLSHGGKAELKGAHWSLWGGPLTKTQKKVKKLW